MSSLIDEVRAARSLPSPEASRLIRESAGVSQERLAAEIGVHRVTMARWEAGTHSPTGPARTKYARILHELEQVLAE